MGSGAGKTRRIRASFDGQFRGPWVRREELTRMPLGKECPLCHVVVSPYTGQRFCDCDNRVKLKKQSGGGLAYRWKFPESRPEDYYPELRAPEIRSKERVAIVGDTHGNLPPLKAALKAAGVIDGEGRRQPGFDRVIHIGDLMDGRRSHQDLQTLQFAEDIFDELLIGNHEAAYLGGEAFAEMEAIDPESQRILNRWEREGKLLVATAVDDWLLTHGGMDPNISVARDGDGIADAAEVGSVADELNEIWRFHRWGDTWDECFRAMGSERGGTDPYGGVLWNDFRRLVGNEQRLRYKQVVGHTPQKHITLSPAGMVVNTDGGRAFHRASSCLVTGPDGIEALISGSK